MTIQEWGSVGELLAAIATLATLVYLARQIRANTRTMESNADRAMFEMSAETAIAIGTNKDSASVFRRGLTNPDSLDPDERLQFNFLFSTLVSQAQASLRDLRRGVSDDTYDRTSATIRLLRTPGGRDYWEYFGRDTSPEFQDHVEQAFREDRQSSSG